MILTKEQVKNLPDGTILKLFLVGSNWAENFGETSNIIKFRNKLYEINSGYFEIDEMDEKGYEFIIAKKEDFIKNE